MSDEAKNAWKWILGIVLLTQVVWLGNEFIEHWDPEKISPSPQMVAQLTQERTAVEKLAAEKAATEKATAEKAAAEKAAAEKTAAAKKEAGGAASAAVEPKAEKSDAATVRPLEAAKADAASADKGGSASAAAGAGGAVKATEPKFDEKLMLKIVFLVGALGGAVHALSSLLAYIGGRQFDPAWIGWYLCRAPIGAGVGAGIYLALRAGLMPSSSGGSGLSVFGFTAISFLAGMFNTQAIAKLTDVAKAIFTTPPPQPNPLTPNRPTIEKIATPTGAAVAAGAAATALEITGSGFTKDAVVLFDGVSLTPVVATVTDRKITVTVPAAQLLVAGKKQVQVVRPGPSGSISEPVTFAVT